MGLFKHICFDVMKIVYPNVAAFSERQSFWLQNQNNQTIITSLHQNQLKQIIYNVEPILQSFRLANTVRRYSITIALWDL